MLGSLKLQKSDKGIRSFDFSEIFKEISASIDVYVAVDRESVPAFGGKDIENRL
jgi:hypothetical protein